MAFVAQFAGLTPNLRQGSRPAFVVGGDRVLSQTFLFKTTQLQIIFLEEAKTVRICGKGCCCSCWYGTGRTSVVCADVPGAMASRPLPPAP